MGQRTLYTIGHSAREWPEFVALLNAWGIEEVIDVRLVPRSRAFTWFTKSRMERALPKAGIKYAHMPALGGLRRVAKASLNTGWQNARFRAYADYMQTHTFTEGLHELNKRRQVGRVCIMCSEAVWWRCHRRMIADAEVARGIPVRHVMSLTSAPRHQLTEFAQVMRHNRRSPPVLAYPAPGAAADASARSSSPPLHPTRDRSPFYT